MRRSGATSLCLAAVLAVALALPGCASLPEDPEARAEAVAINDPAEPFNRAMFDFNMTLDRWVLRPVAIGYDAVVPGPLKTGIRNALDNLSSPVTLLNDLLQGEFERANVTFIRMTFNTTFGLGGLIDIMGEAGVEGHSEDFGQTLAVWGVAEGPYLVLPVFGPSSPRDVGGRVADTLSDPVAWWLGGEVQGWGQAIRSGTGIVDGRARAIKPLDELERTSIDLYATIRSAWRQRRAVEIGNGQALPAEDLYNLVELPETSGTTE